LKKNVEKKGKTVYILLTNTGTLFTRTIKLYTRAEYNHVSIAFDSNLNSLYSFGRLNPYIPMIGGFVRENIKKGTFGRFKNTTFTLYSFTVDEDTFNNMFKIVREFEDKRTLYKYNIIGLLAVILNIPLERENAFFCSQFVAFVLQKSGMDIFGKPASLVTPVDFLESNNLNFISRGKLSEYEPCIEYAEA
jgi:hypothetical protein